MNSYVRWLQEVDRTALNQVGGKGANLGELSAIEGVRVPEGFCITTEAYKKLTGNHRALSILLDELAQLKAGESVLIRDISAKIRAVIEGIPISGDIADAITDYLARFGEQEAFAVRSSATAEDLPTASFAGQQDSYLNVTGREAVLQHISRCWASLFTGRAIVYRLQNGFDHRKVLLSVVVQQMVFPRAAGILFTADPVTGNRKVLSIDAGFGLGEAMVAGLVNADNYMVCNGEVTGKTIPAKKLAIYAVKGGGTGQEEVEPERQHAQVLTDEQIVQLELIARKIEAHFGSPQDIEWCLAGDTFYIVQTRPITTLFPVPGPNGGENRLYVSVGHQQMMTDALKPLGMSVFQLTSVRPRFQAGGRLFVDITDMMASHAGRKSLMQTLGTDPLIKDALLTLIARGDIIQPLPEETEDAQPGNGNTGGLPIGAPLPVDDPAVVTELIMGCEQSVAALKQAVATRSGPALFDFIADDIRQLQQFLFAPKSFNALMAGINAATWISEKMQAWLGEKNEVDTLSQSVPNNVTSEMGLSLLDVADVIRPYPAVTGYLQQAKGERFLEQLGQLEGGMAARSAIEAYLSKYGMRCAGEIDITKPRWSEKPSTLIPVILGNIRNFAPGAGKRKFEQGLQEALKKEQELLARLKQLPDGEQKAAETKRMIAQLRDFIGYREYPKYHIVNRYFIYKQALLKEATHLVQAGAIGEEEDIYYLTFEELREAVRTKKADKQVIAQRKEAHQLHGKLTPPRLITSDGEIITGRYDRENVPTGALAGLAVSTGVIEGRARVILNMEDANLEEGDLLVTKFTDPSWTPLFVSIKGLVTEVGGLMTHGAVIAREYGLPAVVGVENATGLIKDGQRIRVNGTDGFVELL